MQRRAKKIVLILFIVTWWSMCGVELRLCSVSIAKDDRIVFPVDNEEPAETYYGHNQSNTSTSTTSTESPLSNTTLPLVEVNPLNSTDNSNTTTTTTTISTTTLETITTSTELPTVDNRILIDTLPICEPGYKLRAGRCRKSA